MLRKLRPSRPSPAMLVALLALFVALGGSAYAAFVVSSNSEIGPNTIYGANKPTSANDNVVNGSLTGADVNDGSLTGVDVQDFSLKLGDLQGNSVNSARVVDNSLTGTDINESTLAGVDAASVGGVKAVKIFYDRGLDEVTHPEEVLNLGGLVMTAECRSFGDGLDVKARTTKDNASVFLASTNPFNPDDTDTTRDIDGAKFSEGLFTTNDVLEVDNQFPGEDGIGTLIYEAPGGSAVVVHFSLDQLRVGTPGCTMAGVAIGG
jgi:hypothetical protein